MKTSFKKILYIFLVGALIILVSLQLFPRTPSVEKGKIDIRKASLLIEKGETMEGVRMLKGVLEKDPKNIDAIWELGKLSMQSKQYEKAIGRFKSFVSLTDGKEKVSGLIYLSDAYFFNGKKEEAKETLLDAKFLNKDSELETEIEERINIIN